MKVAATTKKKASEEAMSFSVEMDFSKSTKGTHVFTSEADGTPITTLYIQRAAFQGDPPEQIVVNVEASA
jgi:hypothetical protein